MQAHKDTHINKVYKHKNGIKRRETLICTEPY